VEDIIINHLPEIKSGMVCKKLLAALHWRELLAATSRVTGASKSETALAGKLVIELEESVGK